MSDLKKLIIEKAINILSEITDHRAINLEPHTKGMKKYSHGTNHVGYIDKEMNAGVSHKKLHSALKDAGYAYTEKSDGSIGGKEMTYHSYTKAGGPFTDHHVTITTPKGSGKVWNIEHKTSKDNS